MGSLACSGSSMMVIGKSSLLPLTRAAREDGRNGVGLILPSLVMLVEGVAEVEGMGMGLVNGLV